METLATPAQPMPQNRFTVLLGQPWAVRLLAMLGIVIMTIGLYVPVVARDWRFNDGFGDPRPITDTSTLGSMPFALLATPLHRYMPIFVSLGIYMVFSALTLGGLAMLPLLWRPLTSWVRWMYGVWLSLVTIIAAVSVPMWLHPRAQPVVSQPAHITVGPLYLLPGVAVFPLGVLIACAALALMLREPLPTATVAPRTGWQRAAALTMAAGALVWLIGFYLMPQAATAECPSIIFSVTRFSHGACAGLDSNQVVQAAFYDGLNPVARALYTLDRNFDVLILLGLITALGGWTRRLSLATLAWLAAWPALALGVALVALQGVRVVARDGFKLYAATSNHWGMAVGMVVTLAGIGLVALGQAGLWLEWARARRTRLSTSL